MIEKEPKFNLGDLVYARYTGEPLLIVECEKSKDHGYPLYYVQSSLLPRWVAEVDITSENPGA